MNLLCSFNYVFYFYNCITSEVGTIQGEVEQISLMKPKAQGPHDEGFLEYLEDIIGTNQYVEKIEEAYKQ
jgi:structural maintenance of chromosome 4